MIISNKTYCTHLACKHYRESKLFFQLVVWKLLHVLENRLDNTLVQYYDMGKAFLVATDRTLKYLRHIIQDKIIYTKLRRELEDDRKRVARSIGNIFCSSI